MTAISELLDHYRELIEEMEAELDGLESGTFATFDITPNGRTDTTKKSIFDVRRRIDNLKKVVAAHEKKSG